MVKLDEIDKVILTLLGIYGTASAPQISNTLTEMDKSITDRAVLQRIKRLQEKKIIQGYTTILNPNIISEKISIALLLKFRPSVEPTEIERLDYYLTEASFCLSAVRLEAGAGFDYICHLIFDTEKQFHLQFLVLRRAFVDLIIQDRIIKSRIVKQIPYTFSFDHSLEARRKRVPSAKLGLGEIKENKNIEDKLQQFIDDLVRSFDVKHVCLWLLDKSTDKLAPALHSDASRVDQVEYEYVSRSKINIELVLETTRPVLSNDIATDFNITIANWVIGEGVKSYGGYPLVHENQIIGILEIFSDRDFSPAEFELAEILASELSDEIVSIRFGSANDLGFDA
jgi:DNA-binding Lrp family transcriptional regulator